MKKTLTYFLFFISALLVAQDKKTISGKVVDEFNIPIAGATVYASSKIIGSETDIDGIVRGSMIGATTDFDGNFSFRAPLDVQSIIISFIGFETQKVNINNQSTDLFIELIEKEEVLGEVVVTGYQKIEKRKSTSSNAKIKVADIEQGSIPSVDHMLSGQIAGVSVQPTNGAPGAPAKIQIRGIATLSGTSEPLWVLDGIPLEGNDIPKNFDKDNIDDLESYAVASINPNDIESVTILKDAAATSIYGARAANGVIVITTKKGKEGAMNVQFNYTSFVTQKPDFSKLNLMDSNQKVDFELLLASRSDLKYQKNRGEVARILNSFNEYENFQKNGFNSISVNAKNAINSLRKSNTNWGNELYRATINNQYNLNVSGGNETTDYYASLGYFDEEGTTKGTGLKRYNITLKNNYNINNKLNVGLSLFANKNKRFSYITGADSYTSPSYYLRNANPYLQVKDSNSNYVYDPDLVERSDLNLPYNIIEERNNTSYNLVANSIKPILNINYKVSSDLKLATQLGMQFDFNKAEKLALEESYYKRKYRKINSKYLDDNGNDAYFLPKGGIIQNWENDLFQYNWKTTANYNAEFNTIHEVDVMLGTEFRKNKKTEIQTKSFGFNPNTLTSIPITNERIIGNALFNPYKKVITENAFTSFFGTASYTFDRRYTVFGSLRYDGSNLFGVNPKYRYLPLWSVAGLWNVNRESFMYNIDFINALKIRASYGIQGSIDKTTSPFVIGNYHQENILPNTTEDAIRVANIAPNKNLRWEKTTSANIGFDLGMWEDRISLSADYYYRKSTDLIGLRAMPLESGFSFINTNWATVSNKGYEIALNTKNIITKDFNWSSSFNISHNKNEVEAIQNQEESFLPSLKGHPVDAIFAIKTAGIDSNGLPLFWKNGKKVTAVDFYNLSNGTDGKQLSREEYRSLYSYVGNSSPEFSGGFINQFNYKQFNLRVSTNFNINQTVKRTPSYNPTTIQPGNNYSTEVLNAGTGNYPAFIGLNSPGFETDLVYKWYNYGDNGARTYDNLDIWVKNISYLRVNSIKLGYAFPSEYLEKLNLSSLNLTLDARNLFVFGTNYDGYFDPETYGSNYAQPVPKIISFGCNLSF